MYLYTLMNITKTYLDSQSSPPSTISSSINHRETIFQLSNPTPVRGEPTPKNLHRIQNYTKVNEKSVHYNIGGGSNVHIGLVLTYDQ